MPSLDNIRRSKNDAELLAALVALKIAHLAGICAEKPNETLLIYTIPCFAGMQSVCIHSCSKFVCTKVENGETSGASHALLDEIRREIEEIPHVTWVNILSL
jgi:hypothetical protein